jgi:hypothetical protein
LSDEKITKKKYDKGLRWPPFDILHATTNQKHAGMMKGGLDRPRDGARTLGERDGNDEPLAEGDNDDDDKYGEDGNILKNSAPPAESIVHSCTESQRASMPSR